MKTNHNISGNVNFLLAHTIAPILLGVIIYLFGRNLNMLNIGRMVGEIPLIQVNIPNWIKYNFPDFLWMYGFMSFFIWIWRHEINFEGKIWILAIPVIAIGSEMFQALNLIPGTFDSLDVLAYVLALLFVLMNYNPFHSIKHN